MTALAWDQVGEKVFQTGVDRGVLYLPDAAVVWNGLTAIDENPNRENKPYYLDGVKYLQVQSSGEYSAKLKAFTYPEEFDQINGIAPVENGLYLHDQPLSKFSLSYRTIIGNDLNGTDHGYKIHILYNLIAIPDSYSYPTLSESNKPIEFGWTLTGTPVMVTGHRPIVHLSINSLDTDSTRLQAIEDILYGAADTDPSLPTVDVLLGLFGEA